MTKLVLIADDYEGAADLLAAVVSATAGCETRVALNGQEAVDLARQRRPDVVILDIDMPVLNGIQAARAIRDMYGEPPPVLIACTGRAWTGEVRSTKLFQQTFVKPVDLEKLIPWLS